MGVNRNLFKLSTVSLKETEHFQASFRVIIFGSTQIEKISTKELTAWLLSKLHVNRQLKYRLKMIIQTERFRKSSCKHCKTAALGFNPSILKWLLEICATYFLFYSVQFFPVLPFIRKIFLGSPF